jgi:hypothetical protein
MPALVDSEGTSEIARNSLMRSAKSKRGACSPHSQRASVPGPSLQREIARQCDTPRPKIVARTVASLSQVFSAYQWCGR